MEKNRKKRTYETNRFYIHVYWFLLPVEVVANAATTTQLVGLVQVLAAGEQAVAAVVARANDSSKRVLAAGEGGQEEKFTHREMKIIIFGRSFFSIAGEPVELQQ